MHLVVVSRHMNLQYRLNILSLHAFHGNQPWSYQYKALQFRNPKLSPTVYTTTTFLYKQLYRLLLTSHSLSGAKSALQRMILRSLPPPLSKAPPCRTHIVKTLPSWARVCFMIWNVSADGKKGKSKLKQGSCSTYCTSLYLKIKKQV